MKTIVSALLLFLLYFTSSGFSRIFTPDNTIEILQIVKAHLPANPIIIEAGAYNGVDSEKIGKFWPLGKVFAFEPVPELFEKVCHQTHAYPNIQPFQQALSDQNGFVPLYLSMWNGSVGGSSSLLPPKEHLICDPSVTFPEILIVKTNTLDEWARQQGIDQIDFLWLDMQGYELNMIKASRLALNASIIYTEVEFVEAYEGQYLYEDVKSWMLANGFRLLAADFDETKIAEAIKNQRYWANALFIKDR